MTGSRATLGRVNYGKSDALDKLRGLSHLRARVSVHLDEVERALAWEQDFDRVDATAHKFSLFHLRVLGPRHEALPREPLELTAEEMALVLAHVVFVSLEEVEDEVIHLRNIGPAMGGRVGHLLRVALRAEQVLLLDRPELLQVGLFVKKALSLELLPLSLLLSQLREAILPVLRVAAKDALVERAVLVAQLERVHARTLKSVESLRAVAALDRGALRLAAEARKLLSMHQVLKRLADIHPLLPLEAEL